MAARSPRKIFANPFVITLAAIPACSAPPQPQPQPPQVVEPRPETKPDQTPVVVVTNPPPPAPGGGAEQKPPDTFNFDQHWTVMKSGNECHAMARVDCPKPSKPGGPVPTCNPPPPIKYECPANWDGKTQYQIVQWANQANCFVERTDAMKCPKNASCNPPPPQKVTCPKY